MSQTSSDFEFDMAIKKIEALKENFLPELKEMHDLLYTPDITQRMQAVRDKDIVIFLGNTRSGKSTCVNYAIGNHLLGIHIFKKNFNIVKANAQSSGPDIGMGSLSKTTLPSMWVSSRLSGLVVDAPGFDDNRGVAQDVANAFYIKEIINCAKSIKFVLISDINDIVSHNVSQFVTFIDKIHTILPKSVKFSHGIGLVFTKDRKNTTKIQISDMLESKIRIQTLMKVNNRKLVEHFINNVNQIAVVKMPTSEGTVSTENGFDDLVDLIENRLSYISKENLPTIIPAIAEKSKVFLYVARDTLSEWNDLSEALSEIEAEFRRVLDVTMAGPIMQAKNKLEQLQERLVELRSLDVRAQLASLHLLLPGITILADDSILFTKLNFLSFVDNVLFEQPNSALKIKLTTVFDKMVESTSQRYILILEQIEEISQEEATLRLRRVREKFQRASENLEKEKEDLRRHIEAKKRKMLFAILALIILIITAGL